MVAGRAPQNKMPLQSASSGTPPCCTRFKRRTRFSRRHGRMIASCAFPSSTARRPPSSSSRTMRTPMAITACTSIPAAHGPRALTCTRLAPRCSSSAPIRFSYLRRDPCATELPTYLIKRSGVLPALSGPQWDLGLPGPTFRSHQHVPLHCIHSQRSPLAQSMRQGPLGPAQALPPPLRASVTHHYTPPPLLLFNST